KSRSPRICPPFQGLPWSALESTQLVVAASQRPEPSSRSLTRDTSSFFSMLVLATAFLEPLRVTFEVCSITTTFMECHSLALRSREYTPWLVPATSISLGACLRAKTSFPPSPAAFCDQCCPASREWNTPPYSRSLTTPT